MNEHENLKEAILNYFFGNGDGDVDVSVYEFALENMVFEERVKLNCLTCQKFNNNFTCPPAVNYINFEKVFLEYRNGLVVRISLKVLVFLLEHHKNTSIIPFYRLCQANDDNITGREISWVKNMGNNNHNRSRERAVMMPVQTSCAV